jgi:hypothetical protein
MARPVYIHSQTDISDLVGRSLGSDGLVLHEHDFAPEFFELGSGLAGELFQKFTNYRIRLAIVMANPRHYGSRFGELAYEHRRHPLIRFFTVEAEAHAWIEGKSA